VATARQPLTGPRTIGGASTESLTGYVQSVASPFGLWRWSFGFPPLSGAAARRFRGMVTALHGGANAVAVPFCDPDGAPWQALGVSITTQQIRSGLPWMSAGQLRPWSNGRNWSPGRPWAELLQDALRGDSIVSVDVSYGGGALDIGDQFGFGPGYFGLHIVTERIAEGRIRFWPPLRKALAAGDHLTLEPVMAMRLENEGSASLARGLASIESPALTLVEVEDSILRKNLS
jgi:hypothetical protein